MKLNIGCGFNKLEGYVNVDRWPGCKPDVELDAQTFWPWEDCSVDEVLFNHSLEHMGQTPENYLWIWKEAYRVLKPNGILQINCPHPLSDGQIGDPTHVRAISAQSLLLFSRQQCLDFIEKGWPNTPLALIAEVDFQILKIEMVPHPRWGKVAPLEVLHRMSMVEFNVFDEQRITMMRL